VRTDSDVDIDFGDREKILQHIKYIPAAMRKVKPQRKHATGVHITQIPYDPVNDMAAIDYSDAEQRGYFKLDLLNVHVYNQVRDEMHLIELMRNPNWDNLKDKEFVEKLIHLGNHYQSLQKMPEPVTSIPRLAMFLALIRPAKKHLIGKTWREVSKTVWDKGDDGYVFKRSHSCAYAMLVVVHMNLLEESKHSFDKSDASAFASSLV
jgi:hypothetical protein